MRVLVLRADQASSTVADITSTVRGSQAGAYNPYTMSGYVVVNGVQASCHSAWFLEGTRFHSLVTLESVLQIYQSMLAPVRALYRWRPAGMRAFCEEHGGERGSMAELSVHEIVARVWEEARRRL